MESRPDSNPPIVEIKKNLMAESVNQIKEKAGVWTKAGQEWLVSQWDKVRNGPRDVLEEIASSPVGKEGLLIETSEAVANVEELRPLIKGEFFDGNMVVLSSEDTNKFYKKAEELYGPVIGSGKWSVVLDAGENSVAKLFNQPDSRYAAYEFVFMKRFGGKASLPEFRGATVNGFGLEKIKGNTISSLVNRATEGAVSEQYKEKLNGLLSKEQAQNILDQVAEYHKITSRVHGDLVTSKGPENIMIDEAGKVRILDTEWEKIGSQTPQSELTQMHSWLTTNFGIEGLTMPETISDEEAENGLNSFLDEVDEMLVMDSVFRNRVIGFKEDAPEVKVAEDGGILIRKNHEPK